MSINGKMINVKTGQGYFVGEGKIIDPNMIPNPRSWHGNERLSS